MDEASVLPPRTLYTMMGVWSSLTGSTESFQSMPFKYQCTIYHNSGLLGFLANLLAVLLFLKVRKVKSSQVLCLLSFYFGFAFSIQNKKCRNSKYFLFGS